MGLVVFMTLPGLALLLIAMAFLDLALVRARRAGLLPWRWNGRQGQIASTGFEQRHASFSPGKENELPHSTVDLAGGLAVIRLPATGNSGT